MLCSRFLAMLEFLLALSASVMPACGIPEGSYAADVEILYSKGVSLMPMLLITDQIDGYIAWQPYVTLAEACGAGRIACLSRDLPPDGYWNGHPCCVFTGSDHILSDHRDIVSAMCALNIYAIRYIRDHPLEANEIEARWLMGDTDFAFGDTSISSMGLIGRSSPTLLFSVDPSSRWRSMARKIIDEQYSHMGSEHITSSRSGDESLLFDFGPYNEAEAMVSRGMIPAPKPLDEVLGLGWLMGDQHHTPLVVALKRWRYFNDTYGIALRPDSDGDSRPGFADLIVNGSKVAEFSLISAPAGAQLMTLMEQGCIDLAYVGIAPAIGAALLGAETRVIHPIQNEGSGLVVSRGSPAHDWSGFVSWAKDRHSEGRPLRIADPQVGSIQDVLLISALEHENIRAVTAT